MRIQVTTSINVRSNTVPPTPTQSDNASSQPEENRRKIETPRSKSPIPFLPPLPDMATARFKASQRPPPGSRLSAWLHGTSVLNNGRGRSTNHNPKASRTSTYCYHQTPRRRSRDRTTGLRPVASTRGVIDPVHSPTTGAWPVPPRGQEMRHPNRPLSPLDAYQTRMLKEMGYPAPNTRDRRRKTSEGHRKSNRTCFPRIKDPKIRRKAIGCLFFGNILAIILTICTFPFSCPPTAPFRVSSD